MMLQHVQTDNDVITRIDLDVITRTDHDVITRTDHDVITCICYDVTTRTDNDVTTRTSAQNKLFFVIKNHILNKVMKQIVDIPASLLKITFGVRLC